ncbi:MAG: hypothetical protein A2046_05400 [Bacteroidetes bacterium GWA2_30_7]|nr:MAG: hypothetical protein A2046_05400 [Bacteroidetes bacterium GWA2_30_7]
MELQLAKQILSTFNKETFISFVYEMWKILDIETTERTHKISNIPEIGNDIFEIQHIEGHPALPAKQGFNLIIPFFQPIELFDNNKTINLIDNILRIKLEKYKSKIEERLSDWQFWTNGDYIMPNIMFFTNFEGYKEKFYQKHLIPKFNKVVKQIGINYGEIGVGSLDTFFYNNNDKNNTLKALSNFLTNSHREISLSFTNENFNIDVFNSDKYLTKGLLKADNNPYETIFIEKSKCKSEIIKEFEFLINTNVNEQKLETFLTQYYKEIFGYKYDRIETQLWLKFPEIDIANKNRRLDIFLRNSIERDWELFELKKTQKLTATYRDIPVFKSEIQHAIQQIRNYEKILNQEKVKTKFAKEGIEYYNPELRLVVGNKPDISVEQWRFLKTANENRLKIITYEDLISEMKIRYNVHDKYLNNNE